MVTKTNKTYDETTFITTGQDWDVGGSVTVKQGAIIYATGDIALRLSDSPWKVKIDGTVQSSSTHGLWLTGDAGDAKAANSTVTIGSEGTVWGTGVNAAGINAQQATDIVNSGLIKGGTYGIIQEAITPSTSKSVTITNNASGTIVGDTYGINFVDTNHDLIVKNAGTIGLGKATDVSIAFGRSLQLTNSGEIFGDLTLLSPTASSSKITNSGVIGDISNKNGDITLGSGNDVVSNTGAIHGSLKMGGGDDVVTNGIDGEIFLSVNFANGNDKMTNAGQVRAVDLGDGTNIFTNSGTVGLTLTMGSGNDTATNTGIIVGAVNLGSGKNTFTNGGTLEATLAFGGADDIAKNTGTIAGSINFGNGDNTFTNTGDLASTISFGDDDDKLTNSGDIELVVAMGAGNNTVINTGILHAGVTFGTGNDVFKTTHSVSSTIEMGDGNDTFVGGSDRDLVKDGKGDDSYSLGSGNDKIEYAYSGKDAFDGGTGSDAFTAFFTSNGGLFINLDSKAYTHAGVTVAGNSLNTLAGVEVGKIKGFEDLELTSSADWIHGSSAADTLRGAAGANVIIGGGGGDTMSVGDPNAVDTFLYESIKDSGITRLTRDTIDNFAGAGITGGDVIDLFAIDADTKTIGNQAFDFTDNNVPFTKVAGELRAVREGTNTVIQGDVNGDGKADFTILVTGTQTFEEGDFVL